MKKSNFNVNTYANVRKPSVESTTSVNDWFKLISESNHSDTITKARKGKIDYNSTKLSLPCVTYNFLYNDYKKDVNIITSTGLMYVDIDNPNFNIESLDKSKVLSYYKSFGGKGYAIILCVDNLNKSNFKASYLAVTKALGVSEYIDKNAVKSSQFNVLSYDKDIYINDNPFVYSSTTVTTIQNSTPSVVIRKRKKIYTNEGVENENLPIRFNDLDKIEIKGDYIINWEGYEYVKVEIPIKKVIEGKRNSFLLSYCNNLVYLNSHLSFNRTLKIMKNVNVIGCLNPVDDNQIISIVSSIFNYKEDGSLQPHIYPKKRYIVFKQKSPYNKEEKQEIVLQLLAERKCESSREKIYLILESWNFDEHGKIGQTKMHKNYPISKKTVNKYWKEFKDYIKDLNEQFIGHGVDKLKKDNHSSKP